VAITIPAHVRRGDHRGRVGRVAVSLGLGVWFLPPLLPVVLWMFADQWSYPHLLPTAWGINGARAALEQGGLAAFGTSFLLGTAVGAIATPLGALAARALAFHRVRGANWLTGLLFAPIALPAFAVVLGVNVLLLRLHVPSLLGVVLVLVVYALPYTTFTMRAAYGAYDIGFEEEARLLGASRHQVLTRVHVPLIAPAVARAAFLGFLVGWSDYIVTVLIGGGQLVTVPVLVASSASGIGNTAVTAVLSVTAILPPLILLLALQGAGRARKSRPGKRGN
jgi:putative spermidine/putrescine transport system permease protein